MEADKIKYYFELSDNERSVLSIAALMAFDIQVPLLNTIFYRKFKTTEKFIKGVLETGLKGGLLTKQNYGYYQASPDFMIYVYPSLNDCASERRTIEYETRFYYGDKSIKHLSAFLYSLLFDNKKLVDCETAFIANGLNNFRSQIWPIFINPLYHSKLKLLSESFVNKMVLFRINDCYLNLEPLNGVEVEVDSIKPYLSPDVSFKLRGSSGLSRLYDGDFATANQRFLADQSIYLNMGSAIEFLLNGNLKESLVEFEKGLKSQRTINKTRLIPMLPEMVVYYFCALMCLPPEESAPLFRKINISLEKKGFSDLEYDFRAIGYFALNDKNGVRDIKASIDRSLQFKSLEYSGLIRILILYLIDQRPDAAVIDSCIEVVQKAIQNGYALQAYEAAYCLLQWNDDPKVKKLYDDLAQKFGFRPAISQISRQEDWEKTLNGLLSLGVDKGASMAVKVESKSRVVYYVDFDHGHIQPVLQTRNKSGWSAGRNIALRTFKRGEVESMTEQDFKVASKVQVYQRNYYGTDDFDLPMTAIKDLVGHPYVFLMRSKDVLVDLVEAKPSIVVVKSGKGYTLKSELDGSLDKLMVEKETNTRYKIYDLSTKQLAILNAIKQDKIVIPEIGKEKLMQVLGQFSLHLTVHSDLMVTENNNVKNVEADSKIRVQLLPMGDGLKAELFAKPFGVHPPYCKPGKGGKTLIYNEKGEQFQVLREISLEMQNANLLMSEIQSLDSYETVDGLIAFEDPLDSLNLLDILRNHQDICVIEWPEGERVKIKGSASFGNLKFNIKSKSGWFDLQGELTVNESTVISIQELLQLSAKSKNRFIELKDGEFLALSEQLKRQLEELRTFSVVGKDGLQINQFASMALTHFFDEIEDLKADKTWNDFRFRIDNVQHKDFQLPSNLQAELRPYQEEGFRWLSRLAEWGGGACLADDMGLGKTLQTLAILLHRAQIGPALVVCPVSVVPNWISEVAKFAPTLNVKSLSSGIREHTLQNLDCGDLLIISYGILQSEEKALSQISFGTIVLDEAHTIKNFTTKTSKAAMQLQASFRVALTGTPIQNHLGEVWNLFNFINPGLLGTLKYFTDTFIKSDNKQARIQLKKLIAPFILRRLKSAVLDELPPKIEIIKKIELSKEETAYYEALRRQAILNMESDDSAQGTKHLKALAEITRLRQACCNVALIDPTLNIGSSKLAAFLEIVEVLVENNHRALVFSQFVTHLSLVRIALDKLGVRYQYLDGSTPMNEREQRVKKFQSGDGDLFLISLKAGGLGLNLTSADYVIHLDPWWNPAIEDQASDRAHRFGQSKPVTIYRLVAENTIEEKIIQLHNTKRDLADSLLEGSDQAAKLSINELVSLIKDQG